MKNHQGGLYRIYNILFRSDFPLPELSQLAAEDNECEISVQQCTAGEFDFSGFELAYEWLNHDGVAICWCERRGDDYLLVFPRSARFLVTMDGQISCLLHADSEMRVLRHLLLNQVIPRYLATSGHLVLHASAVTLESGLTVAFLGSSGFGKSTLASSFHRHGARLIDDDTILLKPGEDSVTAIGGYPGIRLFPDSVNAVFSEGSGFTHYTPYTDKQQLLLQGDSESGFTEPQALDALFLLVDPSQEDLGEEILIEPVSGSSAMMAAIQSAFSLDPSDRRMITRNFQNIGQAIGDRLAVFSLRYPRDHARLPEVRQAVSERVN